MKILHLLYESRGDLFGIGGAGMRAYDIYGRLRERHDITLLCKKYPGARDGELEGLRHCFAGTESRSLTMAFLSYAAACARFVRRYGDRYDVIVEDFSPAIPTFLHLFTRRPLVLQVQAYTGNLYFRKYNPASAGVLLLLEYLRPRLYDNFIVISAETPKRLGLHNKKIAVIPNGVPRELLDRDPVEDPYVLYLGRIDVYGKGLDILLDAYSGFKRSFQGIRLMVAGGGRDRESFLAAIKRLPEDIRKDVELTGWVSGDRKAELLRRSMFCIMPSRHDVQSIAVLEAMACAKPVVVSDIPELGYVTDCGGGVSFASGSAGSLSAAMKDLAGSGSRREMGMRGREWVKEYTLDKVALRYEAFLGEIANKET